MPTITIDEIEYDSDDLSDEAKNEFNMLQLTDQELARLQIQIAIAQTARNAYAVALNKALPSKKPTKQ